MQKLLLGSSLLALSLLSPLTAQNWPAWRGPTANGLAAADALPPLTWSEEKNVRWKVALPGTGASTPIVWDDRIFLTTAIETDREGESAGPTTSQGQAPTQVHEFVVLAYARSTGELLWRTLVGEGVPTEKGHSTGTYASASALTDGERVYAFFGSGGLYCLDFDGEVQWSKDFGRQKTLEGFGEGASPTLFGDTLVIPWDHEGPSFVAALDAKTGEERWRQSRETDSSWGTPAVVKVGDAAQVIATGSKVTHAYDLATGEPTWSCAGMSSNPVIGPTEANGIVYILNSYQGNVVQAIRLVGASGDITGGEQVLWTHKRHASYVPTPVVHDGLLYFLRDSTGLLSCLDAMTGDVRYERKRLGLGQIHASPICAGERLYVTSRDGVTAVVKVGPEFEILATNRLDDVFDATPVAIGEELFVRGRRNLYCLAESE